MKLNITINNIKKTLDIAPGDILLDVLRREGYYGVKKGCGQGECGACTVLINGAAYKSCLVLAGIAEGKEITTIEALGNPDNLHPIQKAFLEAGAVQCGFCSPGMMLSAKALLDKNPGPTENEIKKALDGNLCRCTGYVKIIKAVKLVSKDIN